MRDGVDAGKIGFRTRVVGVAHVWRDSRTGNGALLSLGGAGFLLEPQAISDRLEGLGFPHRANSVNPGELGFRLQAVGIVHTWRCF